MDFALTNEQSMLRDSVAAFLADHYGFEQRRAALAQAPGWRPDVWRAFAEDLGILGAALPEALGGFGGGPVENMIIMEELGKALVVEPYLDTVVLGGGLLKHSGAAGAADVASRIIAGQVVLAFAHYEPAGRWGHTALATTARPDGAGWVLNGHKAAVVAAPYADKLIVTARTAGGDGDAMGISVFLVDRAQAGVELREYRRFDGFLAAEVVLNNVRLGADAIIGETDGGLALIERVTDEASVALCAEACGVLRKLLEGTVEYTRQRKQFGVPISTFQALQHRMADMFIHVEQSVSMTCMATIRLADPDAKLRAKAASAAKVQIGKSCRFVGQAAIQLHGGMGVTDEMAISHYFRRSTVLEHAFGSVDHHLARYEALTDWDAI